MISGARFERLGHFAPMAAPGGDAAAREPWRMAAGALQALGRQHEIATLSAITTTTFILDTTPPTTTATIPATLPGGFTLDRGILDFSGLLAALADCDDAVEGAEWLHGTLLDALTAWAIAAAETSGVTTVALAGGCFLNARLAALLPARLADAGLTPLLAEGVPPNDGSISLGQAWVARQQLSAGKPLLEVLN